MPKRHRPEHSRRRAWTRGRVAGRVLLALALTTSACQLPRVTTVPPDLAYMPAQRVRSAMWVIAAEIEELERLLDPASPIAPEARRVAVREVLVRMDGAAGQLETPGRTTQHPLLNRNLETFRARLERARRAVEADPPRYFPASAIAGSCALCHGVAQARRDAPPRYAAIDTGGVPEALGALDGARAWNVAQSGFEAAAGASPPSLVGAPGPAWSHSR